MLGTTVYDAVLAYLRKDKRGLSLTVDEFNTLSSYINQRVLNTLAKDFEKDIGSSSDLGFLKTVDSLITFSTGVASLPSDYYRVIGDPYYTDGDSVRRRIDMVTSLESSNREVDYLTQSTVSHPTCVIGDLDDSDVLEIRILPTSIATMYLNYLRLPSTPFLDYYMNDTTYIITYLTVDQSIAIASGDTYRDGTTDVTVASATVDWEWGTDQLPLIVSYFLSALGVILPDELLVQIGEADKAEITSK